MNSHPVRLPLTATDKERIKNLNKRRGTVEEPTAPTSTKSNLAPIAAMRIPIAPGLEDQTLPVLSCEIRLVDPDLAREILKHNGLNRNERPSITRNLKEMMSSGHWMLNGEPILFSPTYDLLNGQHRMRGVIESGVAVAMLFIYGVPNEALGTIDTQGQRTPGDIYDLEERAKYLKEHGVLPPPVMLKYGARIVPNANIIIQYLMNEPGIRIQRYHRDWLIESHKEDFMWALDLAHGKSSKFPAFILGALILAHAHPDFRKDVETIAEAYKSGEHSMGTAAWHMTDMMNRQRSRGTMGHIRGRIEAMGRHLSAIYNGCKGIDTKRSPCGANRAQDLFSLPWLEVCGKIKQSKLLKVR